MRAGILAWMAISSAQGTSRAWCRLLAHRSPKPQPQRDRDPWVPDLLMRYRKGPLNGG